MVKKQKFKVNEINRELPLEKIDFPNPILIGGCGSSGTTLLRRMLNQHPNIVCGPELSVFDRPCLNELNMTHFYTLWRNEDFDFYDKCEVFPLRVNHTGSYFAFHRDIYFKSEEWEQFFDLADNPMEMFRIALSNYAMRCGKKRWAEKTPNNIFNIRGIMDANPDALFIEVVRDGRDAVLSLLQRRNMNHMVGSFRWVASVNAGIYDGSAYPDRYYRIRYEDLAEAPARTLKMICEFLCEEYDPVMLDYWKFKSEEVSNMGYATQPVFKDSIGKWKRKDIDLSLTRGLDLVLREKLVELGYDTD